MPVRESRLRAWPERGDRRARRRGVDLEPSSRGAERKRCEQDLNWRSASPENHVEGEAVRAARGSDVHADVPPTLPLEYERRDAIAAVARVFYRRRRGVSDA